MTTEKLPKNLFYIHGYQSSPDGEKGRLFQTALHAQAIQYRTCPPEELVISECLAQISQTISHDQSCCLIGSSLGGFLAAKTALTHHNIDQLILLNPAIIPPGTNLDEHISVPRSILQDMTEPTLFSTPLSATLTILRGTDDDVVPDSWIIPFAKAQQATIQFVHDDHRFSRNLSTLPLIITDILTKT